MTTVAADLDPSIRASLDAAIADLQAGSRSWARLTLGQRATLLTRIRSSVSEVAEEWADVAATSKGLEPGHPLRGEEWLAGPYAVLVALDAYTASLRALAAGRSPLDGVRLDSAPGGRLRAHTFPSNAVDALLLSGFTGEVWFEPGVDAVEAHRDAGLAQRRPVEPGGTGLVLGAGNVSVIPVLDVLYELLAHNRVVILKLNPTQDALAPVFDRALAGLIQAGFLRIVRGGGDVGRYLTRHPDIAHVHITGSVDTFDAIVSGGDDRPELTTPITAELGGVSPIIVVPGRWSAADLRFQAEHVATMRLHNSGHNCVAGQVVLLSSEWPQRAAFIRELARALDRTPRRPVWYPGSEARRAAAAADYPDARWFADGTRALVEIGPDADPTALETTEYFAPVLGVVSLPGGGQEFLDAAVAYANDRLAGTLGANVLVHPATQSALGDGFERAIADLRYGDIAVNTWTGFAFLTPTVSWGGFPGATAQHPESGIGIVHNALLLDRVERSVVRGPFRPFPRSLSVARYGAFSALPKPPFFVTSRTVTPVGEGLTRFRMDGRLLGVIRTFVHAFRA